MRLGIFGGSFDPVHYGHLLLAEYCREHNNLDQVWFVPAAVSPHKLDRRLNNRPEQSLHKILNGVPAAEMLSLHFMPDWQIADLLAYVVTLDMPQQ